MGFSAMAVLLARELVRWEHTTDRPRASSLVRSTVRWVLGLGVDLMVSVLLWIIYA